MKKEFPSKEELLLKREFPDNRKNRRNPFSYINSDYDDLPVSSTTDCTGLIPSAPQTDEEMESYTEIQPFLPPGRE